MCIPLFINLTSCNILAQIQTCFSQGLELELFVSLAGQFVPQRIKLFCHLFFYSLTIKRPTSCWRSKECVKRSKECVNEERFCLTSSFLKTSEWIRSKPSLEQITVCLFFSVQLFCGVHISLMSMSLCPHSALQTWKKYSETGKESN